MVQEEWRTIADFSNYEISSFGRVWNVKYDRLVKNRLDYYGYEHVSLS